MLLQILRKALVFVCGTILGKGILLALMAVIPALNY
jgi:hypothetical protein